MGLVGDVGFVLLVATVAYFSSPRGRFWLGGLIHRVCFAATAA
jgi:hypothetical protein